MVSIGISLLVCLVGLLMMLVAWDKPKAATVGKIMFAAGLLVTLLMLTGDRSPLLHLR